MAAADGSGSARRLVAGTRPTWSPRGDWIAFVRGGGLLAVRTDGTATSDFADARAAVGPVA